MNHKQKIVNDPVHGFICIRTPLAYELMSHPFFQRLRDVKQLGLTHLVYPGACHTRFQHALGAMHLMYQAIEALRQKGHEITADEAEAAECAMLLHDIGHGPFSHALEFSLTDKTSHEEISLAMMQQLNQELGGRLELTLKIFQNNYPKKFLHQLISAQLDVDRMDYLRRDSFFSGVVEGAIGIERIIKMLNVHNNEVVVEAKGIHSVEEFLLARRLMYWQVYLHKTVIAAEQLLVNIFNRARILAQAGERLPFSETLLFFLQNSIGKSDLNGEHLYQFAQLTDADVYCAIKNGCSHSDHALALLCQMLINRQLPKIEIFNEPIEPSKIAKIETQTAAHWKIDPQEVHYFVISNTLSNRAYSVSNDSINIMMKNGEIRDIYKTSEILDATAFSQNSRKYFLCYPKM